MDPATILGLAAPALHSVHVLLDTVQSIIDAPKDIRSLEEDLLSVEGALESFQALSDAQWALMSEIAIDLLKKTLELCEKSCNKFKRSLGRWTRHSEDGKLSWRDRTVVGLFRQGQIKSMSEQLRSCKLSLTMVVGITNLQISLQQTHKPEETMAMISTKEKELTEAIEKTDKQLSGVDSKVETLGDTNIGEDETEDDQDSALGQVAVEKAALGASRKLLEALLKTAQDAAANAGGSHGRIDIRFGNDNRGAQMGMNYGTNTNTFNNRD